MNFDKKIIYKILRNRISLEKQLKIKIKTSKNFVNLEGDELDIYVAENVLKAISKNFPISVALLLTNEDYSMEDIPIKSVTRKKNLGDVKARIIGTKGKTLKTISELSECYVTLHDSIVSIIGQAEKIKETVTAIESLIRGSKQARVYKYLEKARKKSFLENLGLKE